MKKKFILCGTLGWCLEILFTSFHSFHEKDFTLTGHTSIWMFPIYGLACFITPIYRMLAKRSFFLRGCIYTLLIFLCEFCCGLTLKRHRLCPWDYSRAKLSIRGVIRLDYAPIWFFVGLLYEKFLLKIPVEKKS